VYRELAEQAEPHMRGPHGTDWLVLLDREHANLRAALGWLVGRQQKIVEYGTATEEELAIEMFEESYLVEVLTQRIDVQWSPCIGVWARKPSGS
jgi:hypothetical protein